METLEIDNLKDRVNMALESIRPFLQEDGGDVELVEIDSDKHVKLRLRGSCRDCSMSEMTMRAGIEEAIRKAVPEILSVEAIK